MLSGSFCMRRRSSTGVRSAPPPNQDLLVTTKRVFMWTAGTFGLCGCAISEMPEAQKRGSFVGARDLLAEFRREFAVHGRAMHADFLEHAAVHHRHHAAAAGRAAMVGALPGRADEAARRAVGKRGIRRQGIFQGLKRGADIVAQCLEPGARLGLAAIECRAIHFHINSLGQSYHRAKSCVCRKASPATIAAAIAILSERMPDCMGMRRRTSAALVNGCRNAGALAAEQQHLVCGERMIEIRALCRCGQKDELKPLAPPPLLEGRKRAMTGNADIVDVVHAGAAEGAIGYGKSARLYNVCLDAQAGAQPENRPGVLGDIRFVKRDPHGGSGTPR